MSKRILTAVTCVIALIVPLFTARQPLFDEYAQRFYVSYCNGSTQPQGVDKTEFLFLSGVKGESAFIDKQNFNLAEFLKHFDAKVVLEEQIEQGTSYYAYSPIIKYRATVGGKRVNLHVFVAKNYVAVGAPIIYGGY